MSSQKPMVDDADKPLYSCEFGTERRQINVDRPVIFSSYRMLWSFLLGPNIIVTFFELIVMLGLSPRFQSNMVLLIRIISSKFTFG